MSGQVSIDFEAVYAKKAALKSRLDAMVVQMDSEYQQIISTLGNSLDSEAASALKVTIEANKRKVYMAKEAIDKQLSFMENSTKMVESLDLELEKIFRASEIDSFGR